MSRATCHSSSIPFTLPLPCSFIATTNLLDMDATPPTDNISMLSTLVKGVVSSLYSAATGQTSRSDERSDTTSKTGTPEISANSAHEKDPKVGRKKNEGRWEIEQYVGWMEASAHESKRVRHQVCDTCLQAAAEYLNKSAECGKLYMFAYLSQDQRFTKEDEALLKEILAQTGECQHYRVLARCLGWKTFEGYADASLPSVDIGEYICTYIESTGEWQPKSGWGKLVKCGPWELE